jgi:threonine synthase
MQFRSTRSKYPLVSYKDAVLNCLPDDTGLYVPDQAVDLRQFFLHMNENTSFNELVAAVAPSFFGGCLNPVSASRVAQSAYNFEPELIRLDDSFSLLNLYNGPTGVFKDFGIAFMSALLEEILKKDEQVMILSAACPETGVSMAHAFGGRKGISLVLLYPSGQIRGLDPSAFAQNGGNIIPIQVKGTFDDCERLVVETITDREFSGRYNVTSANSINPGRLFPQVFYYLYAFIKIKNRLSGDFIFSVPSGNFGSLIAGLYAWKFGMPVNGFIAAMNANNAFGDFIMGREFKPRPVKATISPALDVSIPSNYARFSSFYDEAPAVMRNIVFPASIGDRETLKTMEEVWKQYGVLLDPHGAVAFAAARDFVKSDKFSGAHVVVLATGHPAREAAVVEAATGQKVPVPEKFSCLEKETIPIAVIDPHLDVLEGLLASCF